MSKQPPPAHTASAEGTCPTMIQTVGRPGTGSLPSTIAPPDHPRGGGRKAPQNAFDIRREIIWGNKLIQSKGRVLYLKNWEKSNINFIDDILNAYGNFKSGEEIFTMLNTKTNWLIEYKLY